MPVYTYQHPETGETLEIVQTMCEIHEFIKDGIKWNRVFNPPNAAIDTKIDPFSAKDFAEKTGKKRGTVGDLFDQSQEASLKRLSVEGKDSVKETYEAEYSKKRGGRKPYKSSKDVTITI